MKLFRLEHVSLRWKLTFLSAAAIFVIYFFFTCLQYQIVKQWLLKQEEEAMKKTAQEIETYYAEKRNISWAEVKKSERLLEKLNEKYQTIRVLDEKGNVVVSVSNHASTSLSVTGLPKRLEIVHHYMNDERSIVLRTPLQSPSLGGTIEIVRHLVRFKQMMRMLFIIMTMIGVAAMIMSALIGKLIAQQFVGRLKKLTKTIETIKHKGFQERIDLPASKDEMAELMKMFNEMMDQIEHLFNQQKQFIEDASHELRTPIAILEGHLSLLKRWGKNDRQILDESLEAALEEVSRLKKLVLELLELSRAETIIASADSRPINPWETAEKIVKNFQVLHPDFQFFLRNLLTETVLLRISEYHFGQLLLILLDNGVKYSHNEKQIIVTFEEQGHYICISVEDKGIGIPKNQLEKVFLRFYRVDKARSREMGGVGLGLAIAKRIVEKYDGTIVIESEEGKGTTVKLLFPKVTV